MIFCHQQEAAYRTHDFQLFQDDFNSQGILFRCKSNAIFLKNRNTKLVTDRHFRTYENCISSDSFETVTFSSYSVVAANQAILQFRILTHFHFIAQNTVR